MTKRTERLIDFIVFVFVASFIYALIKIIFITLYYIIRTKIDKIKAKRAKKREKKKILAESGRCMIYKGKFVYR